MKKKYLLVNSFFLWALCSCDESNDTKATEANSPSPNVDSIVKDVLSPLTLTSVKNDTAEPTELVSKNDKGNIVEIRYVDANNKLVKSPDYGFAIVRYTYNAAGSCLSEMYFDENFNSCKSDRGYAVLTNSYDADNNLVSTLYLDERGNPINFTDPTPVSAPLVAAEAGVAVVDPDAAPAVAPAEATADATVTAQAAPVTFNNESNVVYSNKSSYSGSSGSYAAPMYDTSGIPIYGYQGSYPVYGYD